MVPSPSPHRNAIEDMRDAVLFDGPERNRRMSRFWILLVLSSVIAAAGVVADSTATVIGAMLSTALSDPKILVRSGTLVITGAATGIYGVARVPVLRPGPGERGVNRPTTVIIIGVMLLEVRAGSSGSTIGISGPEPAPDTAELEALLDAEGIDPSTVEVVLVPTETVQLGEG